jgi:thioredoxin-like negative regulator of GroEL
MKSSLQQPQASDGCSANTDIDRLIEQLNTISECDQAAARLVWCGQSAIPALRRFLFEGRPSVIYQPRRAAVEALGGLRAKDVLIEYLTSKRDIPDAATRFAEDSVKSAAARELAKFRSRDVLEVLLSFALPHSRPGIVEALAQFDSVEPIPYFLRALEDDLCQAAAMDALRRLGQDALLALVTSALTRLPSSDEERPSSLRRRAKALELISEIGIPSSLWPLLRSLLDEDDPPIVAAAGKLATLLGDGKDRSHAAQGLLNVLHRADWYLREEIQMLLIDLYPEAGPFVDQEYEIRGKRPEVERLMDPTVRLLDSVRRKAEGSAPKASEYERDRE